MFSQLLFAAVVGSSGGGGGGGAVPSVANVVVTSLDAGSCASSRDAAIQVAWNLTNPNAGSYDILVYENDILIDTLAGSATSWTKSIPGMCGYPENNPLIDAHSLDLTYRLDVVRHTDGQVVSSAASDTWTHLYGVCP
jgi:hypothetical protein